MKGFTVRQPWAEMIASGAKTVELRRRRVLYRGPVAIHAGLAWDPIALISPAIRQAWHRMGHREYELRRSNPKFVFGAVVAVAELVDCHERADCCAPWGTELSHPYHLILADVRRIEPVPARGFLATPWTLPTDVATRVLEQVPA